MQQPSSPPGHERAAAAHARLARGVYAVCLVVVCFLVLATHVHLGFERVRFRIVASPRTADEATLTVSLPDVARLSGSPAAIIARVRGAGEATRLTLALDDVQLTSVVAPANEQVRIDASAVPGGGEGHELTLTGDRAGWQLDYLEIANVHGFSSGLFSFAIVPRGHPGNPRVPLWLAALVGIGLLVLRPWPEGRDEPGLEPRGAVRVWLVVAGVGAAFVLLLFGAVLLADFVTPYRILLSPATFLLAAAILYVHPLARTIPPLLARLAAGVIVAATTTWRVIRLGVAFVYRKGWLALVPHVTVGILVLWSVAAFYQPKYGFTVFIMFGSAFEPRAVPALRAVPHAVDSTYGYDGQFYAQLALDPLLQDPATAKALDTPSYRARRIFLPWLSNVVGLGIPWLVLQIYALLNVASWMGLAWVLLRWFPPGSASATAAWVACVLGSGVLASMRLALPDGPGALLLALGIAALQADRHWMAAAILGVAGLTRETSLLGGTVLFPSEIPKARRLVTLAVQGAMVVGPLALWLVYLASLGLPADAAGERNFAVPFSAYIQKWITAVGDVRLADAGRDAWFTVAALVALTTQAAALAWWRAWRNPWWRVGMSYAVLLFVLGPAVWEGQPGAVTRVVIPMTLAYNVLLPRGRWFWPLWAVGNANLAHGPMELGLNWFLG